MIYRFADFELDARLFQLRRRGAVVKVEPKIFDVLSFLVRRRDRVVSKDELLEALWPGEFVSESVLPRCIATARKALGDTRARTAVIATVHGRGYRFVAEVHEEPAEGAGSPPKSPAAQESGATQNISPVASARSGPFVGREGTMERLRQILDEALAGQGRMLLLAGEPGIGKTRTAEELAAEARRRGAEVMSARCHEGEGAPAYWPWVQILRACVHGQDPAVVRREMGAGVRDVALLLPELAEGSDAPAAGALPDEARFRLFDSIATFLCRATRDRLLVLVLDDLHAADGPSLLLLQYLATEMRSAPLLVVGTYRDVELRRRHPLVSVLGALARESLCERIHLRGLEREDVSRFLGARADTPPSEKLIAAVHEMTEGNPFFMEEVVRLLESEGRLRPAAEPERWGVILPQSVREAIGRRLDALSPACNRILAAASVIGRDFDVVLLSRVLDAVAADGGGEPAVPSRAELLSALDEAVGIRVLVVESAALGRYAFAHALIRQTLYEELPSPMRLRLHERVADVLEDLHANDLEPPLAEIAHHLFQAAAAGNADKAADYARRAGQRAYSVFAYEDAAGHYERALQLLDLGPTAGSPEQRAEILLAAADADSACGNRERSEESCRRAAAVARKLGRADLLARAALIFGQRGGLGPLPAEELRGMLEESLQALGDDAPALRSRLLSRMSGTAPYQHSLETRTALSEQAVDLARRSSDPTALFDALAARLWSMLGPDHDESRLVAVDEYVRLAEGGGDRERLLLALEHRARSFLALGDLAAADRETRAYEDLAAELRQPSYGLFAKWYRTARALCDGRFAEAHALMQESYVLGERLKHPATRGVLLWHLYWSLRLRGELGDLPRVAGEAFAMYGDVLPLPADIRTPDDVRLGIDALVEQFTFSGAFVPTVVAFVDLEVGAESAARAAFEEIAARDFADLPRDEWWMATVTHLAELAHAFGDVRRCTALYELLLPQERRNAAHSLLRTYGGSVHHFLALLAAGSGRREDAARHFEAALAGNTALGAAPALVRTQWELGRFLALGRAADRRRAQEVLGAAARAAADLELEGVCARIQKEIINSS